MNIELISYTALPDEVCSLAAQTCTSELPPKCAKLSVLNHTIGSGHLSVLEHAQFTFLICDVSRVTETQLVRHRIGTAYSIQSGRYCSRDPTNYVIPLNSPTSEEQEAINEFNQALIKLDRVLESKNIPAEDRRYFYPQGIKTNIMFSVNARELLHIAEERMCFRAQREIRLVVSMMIELAKEVAPTIFEGAGAKCKRLNFCPEAKGCGKMPKKVSI